MDSGRDDFLLLPTGQVLTVTVQPAFRIRFFDHKRTPLAHAPYRVAFGASTVVEGEANGDGVAHVKLPEFCPVTVMVEWGKHPVFDFAFQQEVFPECATGDDLRVATVRLNNLGYPAEADLAYSVRRFQLQYGVDSTPEPQGLLQGKLPPATLAKLDEIFGQDLDASATVEELEESEPFHHSDEGLDLG